jgi:hypothetical protein
MIAQGTMCSAVQDAGGRHPPDGWRRVMQPCHARIEMEIDLWRALGLMFLIKLFRKRIHS